ncbi:MAG: rubrerythrin [Candidatus Lokiarchaeota archaeon]|nr:rubrerythrin [Candidatus Lokiarchaeota archaeon]
MLSIVPTKLGEAKDVDTEILRAGMIAELDAINLYEQMAAVAKDPAIKERLLDIAKEEKVHMGEFQALLLQRDPEQAKCLEEGRKEVVGAKARQGGSKKAGS